MKGAPFLIPAVLFATTGVAQDIDLLPLCTASRIAEVGTQLPDAVAYETSESRMDFVQRVFQCNLPVRANDLYAEARAFSMIDSDFAEVGSIAAWSISETLGSEGIWVAYDGTYQFENTELTAVGVSFVSIEDLLIGVDSTITIPSSDPEIFLPSPDLSSDVTELLRLITESVPGARISDRPASLQIAFSGGISRWYFGDDFVDIAFSTEPEELCLNLGDAA